LCKDMTEKRHKPAKKKITLYDINKALIRAKIDRRLRVFIVTQLKVPFGCCPSKDYTNIYKMY